MEEEKKEWCVRACGRERKREAERKSEGRSLRSFNSSLQFD